MKYKNKIIVYLFILFVASSCNHFNGYKISGKIKNGESIKVYLEDILGDKPIIIDTATISSASFQLKNYSIKGIYRLRFGDDEQQSIFLYIDKNDDIRITADLQILTNYKVSGSKASSSIQEIMTLAQKNFKTLNATVEELKMATPKTKDSLQIVLNTAKKKHIQNIKSFIDKEQNNEVACFALNLLGPFMQDEIPYLISITEKLHEAAPDSKYITASYQQFQQYRDALMQEAEGGIALNTVAPNIILQSPNGDTIQLKNILGSYVLLDFWASWCQPCRMENPNVVKLYNKYHAQGFEVFSVSLDANKEQWLSAIKKDKLNWSNHGCDFNGWNSAVAQQYHVKQIPTTFLLDKKGKVIAKDIFGDELDAKLAELFTEKIN